MKTEFRFLENLAKKYGLSKIGDDAAVLPKDAKTDLVVSADLLVEDIDFRLDWSKPEMIGHKSLSVSVSDVLAMGAKPVWSMLSIGVPEKIWRTDFVERFYEGYMQVAENFRIELIGGDLSKTPDKIVIDSTAAGEIPKGEAVMRSGASPGDSIFVTGDLGGASAGLELLKGGARIDSVTDRSEKNLLLKQIQPEISILENLSDFAAASIDLSDGLSGDLLHICRASRTGAKIFADKIPIDRDLVKVFSEKTGFEFSKYSSALDFALHGGEDFGLLFTAPEKNSEKILRFFSGRVSLIGMITENVEKIELIRNGKSFDLIPESFRHF